MVENQKSDENAPVEEHTANSQDSAMQGPDEVGSQIIQDQDEDEFEVDVLNDNSFMPTFTALVKQMHLNIFPPSEDSTTLPEWMKYLHDAFIKYEDEDNIKLQVYIVKLITNYPEAFEKYAADWILPLLRFVVKGEQFGEPINYLVHDICIILIVWGRTVTLPQAQSYASRKTLYSFIDYLMQHAYHPNYAIVRSNIQIIKGVYENWGNLCHVPTVSKFQSYR